MDIRPYFRLMTEYNASDLFVYPGAPISIKIDGDIRQLGEPLGTTAVRALILSLLNDDQRVEFDKTLELNLALQYPKVGRFRVNVFKQRGELGMVVRYINAVIPPIEDLSLPSIFHELVMEKNGLILVVGATGSGKSTSLAAMISYRAKNTASHILTIEEPIEFMYEHSRSIIGQREVGMDTHSYEAALQSAMREAPDVILVGEVRNRAVMQSTLNFAMTGHLCLTTLHASNAPSALDRITNFFSGEARAQLLTDLAHNLRAIISQRLIINVHNKRIPVVEVMLNTPYISELILKNEFGKVHEAMTNGGTSGMKTFDQALIELYRSGEITKEVAIANADSKNNVALHIRLGVPLAQEIDDMGLAEDELDLDKVDKSAEERITQ